MNFNISINARVFLRKPQVKSNSSKERVKEIGEYKGSGRCKVITVNELTLLEGITSHIENELRNIGVELSDRRLMQLESRVSILATKGVSLKSIKELEYLIHKKQGIREVILNKIGSRQLDRC